MRAAIALYNWFAGGAGSASAVPAPGFGPSLRIALALVIVNSVIAGVFTVVMTADMPPNDPGLRKQELYARLASAPFNLLAVMALMKFALPTTWPRAFLVMLCYAAIAFVVVGMIVVLAIMVSIIAR
jgi:hypothetical protein